MQLQELQRVVVGMNLGRCQLGAPATSAECFPPVVEVLCCSFIPALGEVLVAPEKERDVPQHGCHDVFGFYEFVLEAIGLFSVVLPS